MSNGSPACNACPTTWLAAAGIGRPIRVLKRVSVSVWPKSERSDPQVPPMTVDSVFPGARPRAAAQGPKEGAWKARALAIFLLLSGLVALVPARLAAQEVTRPR